MPQIKLFAFVAALSLLQYVVAQQSCINVCTGSANVLTQIKTCNGCGTDDWDCFCRCQQYMDALMSCVQQNCDGSEVENNIVSFCASQGVTISYSSGSVSIDSTTGSASSTSSSTTSPTTLSTTGTATDGGPFLSSAVAGASGYSGSSFTATESSAISSYLAAAIPASARTESSDACFVNTPYSYYSTPTWYSTLPTQAQSYYSSVNQGNTAACTLTPEAAAALAGSHSGHHGLSAGAIAGIVIGAVLAALLLALLLWFCLRRRRRAHRDDAAARARNYEPRNMPPSTYGSEKGLAGGAVPTSNGRDPYENARGLGGAAGPGQMRQSPYNDGNRLVGAAPIGNGRAAQAPYGNGGPNGFAAAPAGTVGSNMPYGVGGGSNMPYGAGGGLGGPATALGGAALGPDGQRPDYSHTTTTTTRTTIRPRPKSTSTPSIPSSSPPRPPPQPISPQPVAPEPVSSYTSADNYAPIDNNPSRSIPSRPAGRRAF